MQPVNFVAAVRPVRPKLPALILGRGTRRNISYVPAAVLAANIRASVSRVIGKLFWTLVLFMAVRIFWFS